MPDPVPSSNDPGANGELRPAAMVQAHWGRVYRYLYYLTGNHHDAEDLTQEAFTRAFSRLASFAAGTNLRAWLLRIASNAWLDVYRKRQRAPMETLRADPLGAVPPPDRALETSEQAALVQAALQELSDTARAVFHLRVAEELSFREIAEALESTEEAARWHMHQARAKLLKRLGDNI